jgi:hypothetical protein
VTVVSLPARGRPPQAAARRAGLEFVEKLLTTKLTSTDTTVRNAGMLPGSRTVASLCRPGDWLELLVVLVVAAAMEQGGRAVQGLPLRFG